MQNGTINQTANDKKQLTDYRMRRLSLSCITAMQAHSLELLTAVRVKDSYDIFQCKSMSHLLGERLTLHA